MATFLETIDWSEPLWFMANIVSLHAAVVILWSLFFAAIEKYNWFEDSKINKVKSKLSGPEVSKCIKHVAFMHIVVQPPGLLVFYFILRTRMRFDTTVLPSWTETLVHILISLVVEDTLFYWIHRLLHTKYLYPLHKMHHTYHQPIALAAEYQHPIEYVISAAIPLFAGPFLLKSHVSTLYIWLAVRLAEAVDGHSGYDLWFMPFRYFPFRPSSQVHDYHHSHNKGNYGSFFYYWDKLCGTDMSYLAYRESEEKQKD